MNLQNGTLLQGGKYKIVRHISSGGFGNTYEALDVNLDKRVAIKEFFVKDFCSRESDTTLVTIASIAKKPLIEHLKKKFIEEARAIAKMEHENIVKVRALFKENGTAYYVMDYIDGYTLQEVLDQGGLAKFYKYDIDREHCKKKEIRKFEKKDDRKKLEIILKVASALECMHKHNRFHLDVNPANIMLGNDGKVVLINFGAYKQYAEVDGENTSSLAPCYTIGYAPIEQMQQKEVIFTAATDVYALTATLQKMKNGSTPQSAIDLMYEDNWDWDLEPIIDIEFGFPVSIFNKAMFPMRCKRIQSIEVFEAYIYCANISLYIKNFYASINSKILILTSILSLILGIFENFLPSEILIGSMFAALAGVSLSCLWFALEVFCNNRSICRKTNREIVTIVLISIQTFLLFTALCASFLYNPELEEWKFSVPPQAEEWYFRVYVREEPQPIANDTISAITPAETKVEDN